MESVIRLTDSEYLFKIGNLLAFSNFQFGLTLFKFKKALFSFQTLGAKTGY